MAISDLGPGADSSAINAKYKGLSSGKNNGAGKREVDQRNLENALTAQKSSLLSISSIQEIMTISSLIQTVQGILSTIQSIQNSINSLSSKK
jgi:hypothetical protein